MGTDDWPEVCGGLSLTKATDKCRTLEYLFGDERGSNYEI